METGTDEVFEINDFTVVTEGEVLIVALESQFNEWNLKKVRPSAVKQLDKKLKKRTGEIKYKDASYQLTLNYIDVEEDTKEDIDDKANNDEEDEFRYLPAGIKDMIEPEFDFREEEDIFTQYGVFEHIVISARGYEGLICNSNLLHEFQSAVLVASSNVDCEIPIFINYGEENRNAYIGVCQNKSVRTRYEGFELHKYYVKYGYFQGLYDMFKDKVNCPLPNFPPVSTSVRFDYIHKYVNFDDASSTSSDTDMFQLYFGAETNLINELSLSTIWPKLSDQGINESETFSDLDPLLAPRWIVGVKFDSECKQLYNSLGELLDVREADTGNLKVLDCVDYKHDQDNKIGNALSGITQGHPHHDVNFIDSTNAKALRVRQYAKEKLKDILENEFKTTTIAGTGEFYDEIVNGLNQCKSAPDASLISRVSVVLLKCLLAKNDQLAKFCAVWFEFVSYLRLCWENARSIKGICEEAKPELQYCILYQKLEMIQFCIETKRKRHALYDEGNGVQAMGLNSSSSDIFYDAEDEPSESSDTLTVPGSTNTPTGRLEPLDGEYLLDHPDTLIYVPITQDHGPMTEDMIEERAQYLESLEDADKRMRAQLDNVISDMQAFKAANVGSRIEDFVRWHSPRDWVVDDDGNGRLSERMSLENNVWVECWNEARAIPVSAQVRLFNEAKEAETILHLFESITVRELIDLISPVVFHQAGLTLLHNCDNNGVMLVGEEMKQLCKMLQRATMAGLPEDYFDTHKKIQQVEVLLARLQKLKEMFEKELVEVSTMRQQTVDQAMLDTVVMELARDYRSRVLDAPNGPISLCVRNILYRSVEEHKEEEATRPVNDSFFSGKQLKLPAPFRKHYILRTICSRPGVESRLVPQRMYACVGENHFRVCGALTEDLTFH
ncbi:unnamed protein product [Bursaphelenchus okinawaensis]|uniref:Rab3 GTPase-activating protein catalytic subunit n=1 Tax=Bursaphelenchus okinawaensis TaxID=465554 RepID=A0A811KU59_9BILA|nr:unnamed protein product [Bursaphelenchus okinawaensis]CAG9113263.1 unnamed protein product [Bursaphelenchus okinawaensis]